MKSRGPQSLDKVVGRNIRVHRLAKGMSQTDLANELGITFQQIQKYEKGTNCVGSGRLFEISVILGVSVLTLFEGGKATLAKGDDFRRSICWPIRCRYAWFRRLQRFRNGARDTRWSISSN